jgi:hypothetical protein
MTKFQMKNHIFGFCCCGEALSLYLLLSGNQIELGVISYTLAKSWCFLFFVLKAEIIFGVYVRGRKKGTILSIVPLV